MRNGSGIWLIAATLCLLALAPPPAAAQMSVQMEQLFDRLETLERDLRQVESALHRDGRLARAPRPATAPPARGGAGVELRVSKLEGLIRELNGQLETVNHKVGRLIDRLDKLQADLDYRFRELETGSAGTSPVAAAGAAEDAATPEAAGPPASDGGQPAEDTTVSAAAAAAKPAKPAKTERILPDAEPREQYQAARGILRKLDYDRAEAAFNEFLELNAEDPLVGNVYFWLGYIHQVRERYKDAAKAFLQGYNRFPQGPKAPDSLLKLATTLGIMEQRAEACGALDELFERFPRMEDRIRRLAEREKKKYACS